MNRLLNWSLLLLLGSVIASCGVSVAEKEQRRANAFDVSGSYTLSLQSNDNSPVNLELINESDRSNILASIDRNDFTSAEISAFKQNNISLNDVEKFRTHFIIGRGFHNWLEGGENISDDMGLSSRMYLYTNESEALRMGDYKIVYSLTSSLYKNDLTLRGNLKMTIEKFSVDNNVTNFTTVAEVEMPFASKNKTQFANQYMGQWYGNITSDDSTVTYVFSSIDFRKINNASYEVICGQLEFSIQNEKFKLIRKTLSIDNLAIIDFPEVEIIFQGSLGTKITLMGNIYSLGNFVGVIVKTDSKNTAEQIGNLQFKRR
jgi:hypothetical protein